MLVPRRRGGYEVHRFQPNRSEGKPTVASPGPSQGGEHTGGSRPEASGLDLGTNKEANEGEEEQINTAGTKLPPSSAFPTLFWVNPEISVCGWGLAVKLLRVTPFWFKVVKAYRLVNVGFDTTAYCANI